VSTRDPRAIVEHAVDRLTHDLDAYYALLAEDVCTPPDPSDAVARKRERSTSVSGSRFPTTAAQSRSSS
jgi:hypothetical protein